MYINTSPCTKKPAKMLAKEAVFNATRAKLKEMNTLNRTIDMSKIRLKAKANQEG